MALCEPFFKKNFFKLHYDAFTILLNIYDETFLREQLTVKSCILFMSIFFAFCLDFVSKETGFPKKLILIQSH